MRVIALIDDLAIVRRILEHLGLWAPEAPQRGPPARRRRDLGLGARGAAQIAPAYPRVRL